MTKSKRRGTVPKMSDTFRNAVIAQRPPAKGTKEYKELTSSNDNLSYLLGLPYSERILELKRLLIDQAMAFDPGYLKRNRYKRYWYKYDWQTDYSTRTNPLQDARHDSFLRVATNSAWFTPKQTAEVLEISTSTLLKWVKRFNSHFSENTRLNRRRYTPDDLMILKNIAELRAIGISLDDISKELTKIPLSKKKAKLVFDFPGISNDYELVLAICEPLKTALQTVKQSYYREQKIEKATYRIDDSGETMGGRIKRGKIKSSGGSKSAEMSDQIMSAHELIGGTGDEGKYYSQTRPPADVYRDWLEENLDAINRLNPKQSELIQLAKRFLDTPSERERGKKGTKTEMFEFIAVESGLEFETVRKRWQRLVIPRFIPPTAASQTFKLKGKAKLDGRYLRPYPQKKE